MMLHLTSQTGRFLMRSVQIFYSLCLVGLIEKGWFIQCGQEVGALFSSLARSWEKAETSNSSKIAATLPLLEDSLNDNVTFGKYWNYLSTFYAWENNWNPNSSFSSITAIGRRLSAAGRRFQGMGQYGEGELLRVHASAGPSLAQSLSSVSRFFRGYSKIFGFL